MSKSTSVLDNDDGFTVVKGRKAARRLKNGQSLHTSMVNKTCPIDSEIDKSKLILQLKKCR